MAKREVIENIKSGVGRLIGEHRRLQESFRSLASERDSLSSENRALREELSELKKELSTLRLADGFGGGSVDKTKAKSRLNRLMREVDACIALLKVEQVNKI